uniref:transmembrane protein 19-like isoform X1 n=1 Tax=Myxine glutinosa TaxID=7769 RepID=UPI00358F1D3A
MLPLPGVHGRQTQSKVQNEAPSAEDLQRFLFNLLLYGFVLTASFGLWTLLLLASSHDRVHMVSPWRCVLAIAVPTYVYLRGVRHGATSYGGAVLGVFTAFLLSVTSYCYLATFIIFFYTTVHLRYWRLERLSSTSASKVHAGKVQDEYELEQTSKEEWEKFPKSRCAKLIKTWPRRLKAVITTKDEPWSCTRVFCRFALPGELALFSLLESGSCEIPIDFHHNYAASWLVLAFLTAISSACGDAWATEFGKVLGSGQPVLITTLQPVPAGTTGGVTLAGLSASFAGGLSMGLTYLATLVLASEEQPMWPIASQWPLVLFGGVAGLLGYLLNSYLGAEFQFSGFHTKLGMVVERPGPDVLQITGKPVFDNDAIDLLSAILLSLTLPGLAVRLWP